MEEIKEELKGKFVTPIGEFNCQSYPIDEDNKYFITDEELEKLNNHELKWSSEEYETEVPVYEEKENEETHELEQVQVGSEKVTKTRPILVDHDNSSDLRKEEIQNRINELKQLLKDSDYRAIKFAEGQYTKTEYAPYKEQRKAYRDEINQLEEELEELNKPLNKEEEL